MIQTLEASNTLVKTQPIAFEALPVLISIPNMATCGRGFRPRGRRRRLRREVRIAGYVLLALMPVSMVLVALGGDRSDSRAAALTVEHGPDPAGSTSNRPPTCSISIGPLEPVMVNVHREIETPVILPGYLLPADTSEESRDGGH